MSNSTKVAIRGNTYPVKDQLKALGAKWDGVEKCWMIDESKQEQALAIVRAAPAKDPNAKRDFRPSRCKQCGAAGTRYNRIYRNGICRDCYQSDKEEAEMGY